MPVLPVVVFASIVIVPVVILGVFSYLSCECESFADEPLHYRPMPKKEYECKN